jgi:RHS repeat-associated protein
VTWTYVWDAENQLKWACNTTPCTEAASVASFKYDPLGRRVEKVAGGLTTTYTYNGEDILRQIAGGSTLKYVHGPAIDEPLAQEDGAGVLSYFHADGLGSTVKTTSSAGSVTSTRRYDAFGNFELGATNGYAFTGREWDSETGLAYYRARYYDPKIGRFISEDPIGLDGGDINFYAYVGNNPINWTDPAGLAWLPPPGTLSHVANFWEGLYQDFRQRRSVGQQRFPLEPNSYMRHCVTSCLAARDYGNTWVPRIFGSANEAQGFLMHDIPRLRSRLRGQTAWAFQLDDFASNEVGFACAGRRCESCEECCGNIGPFGP